MKICLLIVTLLGLLTPALARAEAIMPLDEVRPGMRGYGLTVFRGTTPERFDVEVIDVLHGFRTRQDLILIRMHHPILDHSGTVGGMSGSPIYIEGRLIGALAYGWMFSLDPIAGVTPIETMLEELDRPLRPPPMIGSPIPRSLSAARRRAASTPLNGPTPTAYWQGFRGSEGPVPATTPLMLGGFTAGVREMLGELLGDFSLLPLEAGGGGNRPGSSEAGAPRPFVPGGPLGVQLVRGDLSATAIGTVTALRGDRVLAFGHPMFGHGQQHYPVTTARILHIMANLRRSFKMGEPEDEAGALIQDRQPCIIADTTREALMTALDIRVQDRTSGRHDRFQIEVVRDPQILPILGVSSVISVLDRFASDRADMNVVMRGTLYSTGHAPITLEDQVFTDLGAADRSAFAGMRPLAAIREILDNGFEHAAIERIDLEVTYDFTRTDAEILGAYVTTEAPRPGESLPVHVVLRPFAGPEEVRVIRVALPESLEEGANLQIEISGGNNASPPRPEPQSLDEVLQNLRRTFPSTSIVVTLRQSTPGVSVRGHIAEDLPPSALDSLRPVASDMDEDQLQTVLQQAVPTNWVLTGSARLRLRAGQPEH
jgi:hypothetical protein